MGTYLESLDVLCPRSRRRGLWQQRFPPCFDVERGSHGTSPLSLDMEHSHSLHQYLLQNPAHFYNSSCPFQQSTESALNQATLGVARDSDEYSFAHDLCLKSHGPSDVQSSLIFWFRLHFLSHCCHRYIFKLPSAILPQDTTCLVFEYGMRNTQLTSPDIT